MQKAVHIYEQPLLETLRERLFKTHPVPLILYSF